MLTTEDGETSTVAKGRLGCYVSAVYLPTFGITRSRVKSISEISKSKQERLQTGVAWTLSQVNFESWRCEGGAFYPTSDGSRSK